MPSTSIAERGIFLVVDGIGGQAAGEKAAAIAVERIRARLERQPAPPSSASAKPSPSPTTKSWPPPAPIPSGTAWLACSRWPCSKTDRHSSATWAIRASISSARGEIRKVTHDHSPVGEREDAGEIGEAEAMRHPRRNEVFRDVGSEEHAPDDANFIEMERIPFDAESALLLCSDGLSDQVPSERSGAPSNATRATPMPPRAR